MKVAPDEFDSLTPEERHGFYKMLRLKVVTNLQGSFEYSQSTKRPELAFPCFAR
jgi:hypothetical protein